MEMGNLKNESKPKSVEKVLRPMTFVCWILGIGISRPLKWPKIATNIVRFFHFVVCSVIVAYGAIDFFTFGSVFKSDIFKIMYYSNKVACYVSSYYYVYHGIHHYEKWPTLMEEIANIDTKMRRYFSDNSDKYLKICQLIYLLVVLVLGPMSLISHGVYYYFIRPQDIFASDLLLYYTMAQSLSVNFAFDLIVIAIYSRYKAINRVIMKIDETYTAALIIHEIRRSRELHHALGQTVRFLNGIYGVHLLLSSVNSFTMVVATLFRIYMGVVERKYEFMLINNVIWVTYTAQFAVTCCICTKASKESSKTAVFVHDIVLRRARKVRAPCDLYTVDNARVSLDSEISLRHEINDFSSQLQQRDVEFSACEFFVMNNELLRSFVGVITTYLIILVQFYEPESRNKIEELSTLPPEAIEI